MQFRFLVPFQFPATVQMIRSHSVDFGPDYVKLNWPHPKFAPVMYQVKYMVTINSTCTSNHGTHNYTMTEAKSLRSEPNSVTLPSSSCRLNLLAVYNPASIDTGIDITITPLYENTKTG